MSYLSIYMNGKKGVIGKKTKEFEHLINIPKPHLSIHPWTCFYKVRKKCKMMKIAMILNHVIIFAKDELLHLVQELYFFLTQLLFLEDFREIMVTMIQSKYLPTNIYYRYWNCSMFKVAGPVGSGIQYIFMVSFFYKNYWLQITILEINNFS